MRVFIPLILLYGFVFFALAAMAGAKTPRTRILIAAAVLTSILLLFFAGLGLFIDQGYAGSIFVIPLLVVLGAVGYVKLVQFIAGKLRRVQSQPTDPKE